MARTVGRASGVALAALLLAVASPAQKKTVVVSWDGAADWVVDRLLAEGKLPNVARMARDGVRAESMAPALPSTTAGGHAAIFTGAWADRNGVSGDSVPLVPKSEHTHLESQSGSSSNALQAEPIYVTAAKAGRKVALLSASQSSPASTHLASIAEAGASSGRFVSFSGAENQMFPGKMVDPSRRVVPEDAWPSLPKGQGPYREITLTLGDEEFFFLFFDDPKDPVAGYDSILVRQHNRSARSNRGECILKPREASEELDAWSPAFHLRSGDLSGNVYFRLFALSPDLGTVELYQRSVSGLRGSATAEEIESYTDVYGGSHDDVFPGYAAGVFGKPLWEGGDGTAERRVIELVKLDCEFLRRGTRYALKRWTPDLLIHSAPMIDGAGRAWMGVLDPESPRHDEALAAKIWPFYERVYELEDQWLGDVLETVDRSTVVALVSDHGMQGCAKTFFPNAVLEKAGLVVRTIDDKVQLAQARVFAPPYAEFFLVANTRERKGGIVEQEEAASLLDLARTALLAARDPESGAKIVADVWTREEAAAMGGGGPMGGDLYFDLTPGYFPSSQISRKIVGPFGGPVGAGAHGLAPSRSKAKAILFLAGPGVPRGTLLEAVRQIDVAPTLAALMGIPSPTSAIGRDLLAGGG